MWAGRPPLCHDEPCYRRWDAQGRAGGERAWCGCPTGLALTSAWASAVPLPRTIGRPGTSMNKTERWWMPLDYWDDHHGRSHAFGTVTLGYDYQFSPRWVAGAFVDYDFGNKNDHTRSCFRRRPFQHPPVGKRRTRMVDRRQARRPIEPEHTLVRVSRLDASFDRSRPFLRVRGTERRLTLDKERDGWFVGAGIETQLGWLGNGGFSLRGEYRFTRLDDDERRLTLERISAAWVATDASHSIATSMFTRCARCWSTNSGAPRNPSQSSSRNDP